MDRLRSKIWKTRQSAIDDLIKAFTSQENPDDHIFSEYIEEFPRLASDSNLMAQDKALEAFIALINKANIGLIRDFARKDFMKIIIEKGYCTGKNNIKEKVLTIIYHFFEKIDRKSVIEGLIDLFPHKNQKVFNL